MVYPYNRILFSLQKEGNSDTWHNMNEPWKHYAKWNKTDTKGNSQRQKIDYRLSEAGKRGEGGVTVSWVQSFCLEKMKNFRK